MSITELVMRENDSRFDFLRRITPYTGMEGIVYFQGGTRKSGTLEVHKNALCIYLNLSGGSVFKLNVTTIEKVEILG